MYLTKGTQEQKEKEPEELKVKSPWKKKKKVSVHLLCDLRLVTETFRTPIVLLVNKG